MFLNVEGKTNFKIELESKYKDKLHFKFIEDLEFKKRVFNASPLGMGGFNYCNKEYPSGDTISVIQNPQKAWFVTDSITDQEEPSDNKVLANIDFLKAQHRVLGIQQSLSRGF